MVKQIDCDSKLCGSVNLYIIAINTVCQLYFYVEHVVDKSNKDYITFGC